MYDVIKNERNKCVNQIQICTQRAAEMREKLKILGNEYEILRTSSNQKEKQLQRQRLKYANSISLRDSIRNEKEKQKKILDELKVIEDQQSRNIGNYNNIVNYNEEESTRLRKKYEESIKERNARGIDLIKRSEELCVICERSNAQETLIKNGNIELQAREEELRFLKLRLEEEKRVLNLYRREAPNEEAMNNELSILRAQLVDGQDHLLKLERQMENCNDPSRIRLLDGPEETAETVIKKLEELEFKLAKVEEQCLEKDLIIEQVNRLTNFFDFYQLCGKQEDIDRLNKERAFCTETNGTANKLKLKADELKENGQVDEAVEFYKKCEIYLKQVNAVWLRDDYFEEIEKSYREMGRPEEAERLRDEISWE